jgi:alkanesulfonate monooxygenase SsuD/methylene tetrahydromethanopterin reductase-like flavin-dependent oxidoreductase (luciferase family)
MRFGITILPEDPWAASGPRWRAAEDMGFDHAWTYDHLVWAGLPDSPWYGALPTLAAAATTTSRIGLGTFVSSPNYRHPYLFLRDLLAVDDISGGRLLVGLGTGGDLDAGILGEDLSLRERVDRFHEFVAALDTLATRDHVDLDGPTYRTVDARTTPGPVQSPRFPFVVAANGPRSLRLAARYGQGWVTYGVGGDTLEDWWAGIGRLCATLTEVEQDSGRTTPLARYLSLDGAPRFSLESADFFADQVGRAAELGFTDVVTHWPRADGVYAGRESVLEEVASRHASLARARPPEPVGGGPTPKSAEGEEHDRRARRLLRTAGRLDRDAGAGGGRGISLELDRQRGRAAVRHHAGVDHPAAGLVEPDLEVLAVRRSRHVVGDEDRLAQ